MIVNEILDIIRNGNTLEEKWGLYRNHAIADKYLVWWVRGTNHIPHGLYIMPKSKAPANQRKVKPIKKEGYNIFLYDKEI